ncbi:2'-5' RNA ligase family protein [Halomicrococcus gelatinilyticus]|uniref:2'-5' RNA ligase family protein n=1 Tax=Halomicrococcus gelatinilyticus TaxID=1702103 RepID=UPI002E10B8E7
MYSLNVPVPGAVERIASDLHPDLVAFDSVRERHTLVCKRLGDGSVARLQTQVRTALADTPAFEARVAGVDYFERPARGDGPVFYLAVESPGLRDCHRRLCSTFDPVDDIEGDDYVPHVTLARGGSVDAARRLAEREVDPVTWTVSRLVLWDATYEEPAAEFRLPA